MVKFPKLHRQSTLELPFIAFVGSMAGGFTLHFSRIIAAICFLPAVYWIVSGLWLSWLNRRIELRWLKQFPQCIKERDLERLVKKEPTRYLIHYQYYGGVDAVRLPPMSVLEDRQNGDLMAVYPCSYKALELCEKAGVEMTPPRIPPQRPVMT